jgi:hypothetical protein
MSKTNQRPQEQPAPQLTDEQRLTPEERKVLKAYQNLISMGGKRPHVEFRDSLFRLLHQIALYTEISRNSQLKSDTDFLLIMQIFFLETDPQ